MLKKLALGAGAVSLALASIPMFAAFEAHVINVTARIENALQVDTTPIDYGTVFPQEALDRSIHLHLSESFLDEQNADDVDYVIKQKPKCQLEDGTYGRVKEVSDQGETRFECVDEDAVLLPVLCPYLSKHKLNDCDEVKGDPEDEIEGCQGNDSELNPFHGSANWTPDDTENTEIEGRLAKSERDTDDWWNIDLRVPCFEGHCAQDWDRFVLANNPDADPDDFVQPVENEHAIFGCDLWIEVTGVSRLPLPEPTP